MKKPTRKRLTLSGETLRRMTVPAIQPRRPLARQLKAKHLRLAKGGLTTIGETWFGCYTEVLCGPSGSPCLSVEQCETERMTCVTHLDCSGNQFCETQGPNYCG